MSGLEKFRFGHFTPTPKEEKENSEMKEKMAAANEALRRKASQKTIKESEKDMEKMPEEELEAA